MALPSQNHGLVVLRHAHLADRRLSGAGLLEVVVPVRGEGVVLARPRPNGTHAGRVVAALDQGAAVGELEHGEF